MNRTQTISLGFFLAFFAYFAFTGYHLPDGAGPDYRYSQAAADFYHAENRMAIYPDDTDKMVFSRYGNSRLLRPPLAYFLAAQMAKLPILKDVERYYAYRLTIAMLAGLTLMFVFLALRVYFSSQWGAAFGTLSLALMPQFSFYASYFSDDMAAFLASSVLAYSMVLIFKHGVTLKRQLLFAFAAGLCIASKQTAWVFLIPAILFYFLFMLDYSLDHFKSRDFYLPFSLMTLVFIVGGGWWLLFNVYHYGLNDFRLSNIAVELMNQHSRVELTNLGYGAYGIGIKQLVFLNYHNFIGATYIAFVGNMNWLDLKVGDWQYGFYLWVVIGIILNGFILLYKSAEFVIERLRLLTFEKMPKYILFELLLYIAIILQIYLFLDHNVSADIQIQGKYLMTILLPMLILALSFYIKVIDYLRERFREFALPSVAKNAIFCILVAIPVLVHLDALVNHVVPFYWPQVNIPAPLSWL